MYFKRKFDLTLQYITTAKSPHGFYPCGDDTNYSNVVSLYYSSTSSSASTEVKISTGKTEQMKARIIPIPLQHPSQNKSSEILQLRKPRVTTNQKYKASTKSADRSNEIVWLRRKPFSRNDCVVQKTNIKFDKNKRPTITIGIDSVFIRHKLGYGYG